MLSWMDGLKKLKEKHRHRVRFGTLQRDTPWTACLLIGRVVQESWPLPFGFQVLILDFSLLQWSRSAVWSPLPVWVGGTAKGA